MNQADLFELYESIKGNAASAASQATQLADVISSGHEHLNDIMSLLASHYAFLSSPPKTTDMYTAVAQPFPGLPYFNETAVYHRYIDTSGEMVEEINATIAKAYDSIPDEYKSGGIATFTINNSKDVFVIKMSRTIVYVNNFMILSAIARVSPMPRGGDILWLTTLPEHVLGEVRSIKDSFYEVISGFGVVENYANVLRRASTVLSGTGENVSATLTAIIDYVKNQQWLSGFDKDEIISSMSNGVESLIQTVANKWMSFKRECDSAVDEGETTFLSDTAITLSNFAPGIILGTIEAVLSVVSVVAFAVSKVIGAVMFVAQSIFSIVSKIMLAATTSFEDTRFKISYNSKTCDSVMSFCMDQVSNYNFPALAGYMRERGITRVTFEPGEFSPLIFYIFLSNPSATEESYEYNYVNYEVHLSLMFDVFRGTALKVRLGNVPQKIQDLCAYWGFSPLGLGYTGDLLMQAHGSYNNVFLIEDPETHKYIFLTYVPTDAESPYDSGPVSLPFAAISRMNLEGSIFTPEELMKYAYSPISFSRFSFVSWLFNDSDQIVIYRRLCSALLLVLYKYFAFPLLSEEAGASLPANSWLIPCFLTDSSAGRIVWTYGSNVLKVDTVKLANFMRGLIGPITHNSVTLVDMAMDYTATELWKYIDELTTGISLLFNQVLFTRIMQGCAAKSDNHCYLYAISGPANVAATWNDFAVVNNQDGSIPVLVNFCCPVVYYENGVSLLDAEHVINAWPTKFLVDLPKLTFSGFISGLIVDGLMVAAATAVATLAVIGKVALKNKAAQLQARTEGAWYNYEDNYDDSGTPEAKASNKALWKNYKRTRMKSNILNMFNGTGSISMGLYDDANSDSESILGKISGFAISENSDDDQDSPNLSLIYGVLTGNF